MTGQVMSGEDSLHRRFMPFLMALVFQAIAQQEIGKLGPPGFIVKSDESLRMLAKKSRRDILRAGRLGLAVFHRPESLAECPFAASVTPTRHVEHGWEQCTDFE